MAPDMAAAAELVRSGAVVAAAGLPLPEVWIEAQRIGGSVDRDSALARIPPPLDGEGLGVGCGRRHRRGFCTPTPDPSPRRVEDRRNGFDMRHLARHHWRMQGSHDTWAMDFKGYSAPSMCRAASADDPGPGVPLSSRLVAVDRMDGEHVRAVLDAAFRAFAAKAMRFDSTRRLPRRGCRLSALPARLIQAGVLPGGSLRPVRSRTAGLSGCTCDHADTAVRRRPRCARGSSLRDVQPGYNKGVRTRHWASLWRPPSRLGREGEARRLTPA